METMLEATARLQQSGYKLDLTALPGARIHCSACDAAIDAHEATVEEWAAPRFPDSGRR